MRPAVRQLIAILAETMHAPEPVFEFGALQVDDQQAIANLRPLFPGVAYVGCDARPGPGVDRVLDLERLDLASGLVGTAIVAETLEHVRDPIRAVDEVARVLQPDGVAILTSCLDFKIHAYPDDYWRFTPSAFRHLLRDFHTAIVGAQGHPAFPHTIFGVGFRGDPAGRDAALVDALRRRMPIECRLGARATKRAKWFLGEHLIAKRLFRRLRHRDDVEVRLHRRAGTPN
ncbi:MAG: methyltransferase domain-containing protein [Planctomycetes bacterium]|nr:methyltransferase domain-containing protein [Planctomycetota bacterium]MBI3848373.1 methyltransferase domain-containing protein [Planctomycetota bacterium]